jgi:hypothetical protein
VRGRSCAAGRSGAGASDADAGVAPSGFSFSAIY